MTAIRRPAAVTRAATSVSASTATRSTDTPRADDSNAVCTRASHGAAAAIYDPGLERSPTTTSTPGGRDASDAVHDTAVHKNATFRGYVIGKRKL